MDAQRGLSRRAFTSRFFGYSGTVLFIGVLISVIIYLAVQRSKPPPPASTIMVQKDCPVCPDCDVCLTYELMSELKPSDHLVSPGVMYMLNIAPNSLTLKGYDQIWKIDAPGASKMLVNKKGQLIVTNDKGETVYETPAQPEGLFVAYVTNQGKLEIMNRSTRTVVFTK